MIDIRSFVSSYDLSFELNTFEIPIVIYDGCFVYEKRPTPSIPENELIYVVVDCGNNQLSAIPINADKVFVKTFKEGEFIKGYTSAEIGELLPIDYTLPVKVDEGWAFLGADGNIYTDYYYENETEARIMFLLLFLKTKQLTVEDLIGEVNDDQDVQSE